VFDKKLVVPAADVRAEAHRITDALIGALTGTAGGFASQMTFVYGTAKLRRAYIIDADGHDPHAVSTDEQVVLAPAFGPRHQHYYAASVKYSPYKIFTPGAAEPIALNHRGSVYGIAFSPERDRVAVSIAVEDTIRLFAGPDFQHLELASPVRLTMQPTFTPSGKVAFVGAGKWSQRVFVGDKPISPDGLSASAPVFCRHPDGVRAVFAVGVGKDLDLVATVRLTQGQGRNSYPACSPDGRLVAFFSTRKSNEGPGLYVMRIDGSRPKRISTLVGDSLVWARLPEPAAAATESKR
jgi:TolB protein